MTRPDAVPPLGPVFDFMRALWALDHALQRASRHLETTVGITGPQRMVLRVLERFPGMLAGQLAATLHLHPSTLTGILQRLEREGLIVRRVDPRDRRRVQLGLTPEGQRLVSTTAGPVEEATRAILDDHDPRTVRAALDVIAAITAQVNARGGSPRDAAGSTSRSRSAAAPRARSRSSRR